MIHRKLFVAICGGALVLAACSGAAVPLSSPPAASATPDPTTTTVTAPDGGPSTTSVVLDEAATPEESDPSLEDSSSVESSYVPLDLAVGTCFDDPSDDIDLVTPDNVPVVGCDSPHDNEVFGNFDIGGQAFPGTEPVQKEADSLCHGAFEGYVGIAYESSVYDFSWYFPTAESWPIGGTNVICFAYNTDLTSMTGSVAGAQR